MAFIYTFAVIPLNNISSQRLLITQHFHIHSFDYFHHLLFTIHSISTIFDSGDWVSGVREGQGKETLKDSTFKGQFVDDLVCVLLSLFVLLFAPFFGSPLNPKLIFLSERTRNVC